MGTLMRSLRQRFWTGAVGQDIAEYSVMPAVILVIVVGTLRLVIGIIGVNLQHLRMHYWHSIPADRSFFNNQLLRGTSKLPRNGARLLFRDSARPGFRIEFELRIVFAASKFLPARRRCR